MWGGVRVWGAGIGGGREWGAAIGGGTGTDGRVWGLVRVFVELVVGGGGRV